jgi:small subunit ribosomal protein S16
MLMIRLRRGGAKNNPVYRVVVSDSRKDTQAEYLDQVGFYNPHLDPPEIRLDLEKVEKWQRSSNECDERPADRDRKGAG